MPKERNRPSTRKERLKQQRENYLSGKASRPYHHTPALSRSFEAERPERESPVSNDTTGSNSTTVAGPSTNASAIATAGPSVTSTEQDKICARCLTVLSRYKTTFEGLVHTGSTRKSRISQNPHPKRVNVQPYRDLQAQNTWLRNNIFDSMGNYLFCCRCVCIAFCISPQRLSRQRKVKQAQFQKPTVEMLKTDVEQQNLGQYVVMPNHCDTGFGEWWRSLPTTTKVLVRYPHEQHKNAGRVSNSAKQSVMQDFVSFVDTNSQPNGRSADSHGPTFYFVSSFTTIEMPKKNVSNYETRMQRSVVGIFNKVQREMGKEGCSNGSAHNWLHKHRPKVAICPAKQDYCDFCAKHNTEIHVKQTTLSRIRQTGSASVEECQGIEAEIKTLQESLEEHRTKAKCSHEYYLDMVKRCKDALQKIEQCEADSTDSTEELVQLRERFTLTLSADYQMSKLIPHWGLLPQPGSTYYLQKLSHDILGIVNHSDEKKSAIYVFSECVGPKNTDHTVSYMTDYLCESGLVPPWVKRLHIFMDNACSTNKNSYMLGWANEMVQQGWFCFIRISFLISGHTKFAPDLLFSRIAQSYNRSDVFNTTELGQIAEQYANVVIDDGERVRPWRASLEKYSQLPGIRALHDFVFARNPGCDVKMKARSLCYTGQLANTEFHVKRGYRLQDCAIPSENYKDKHLIRPITTAKHAHLQQMFKNFIPPERHMPLDCIYF